VAAKQKGFKILVDFHYTHWWADPANQWKPTSWSGDTTADAVRNRVSAWTRNAMTTLVNAGAAPDMVQVGNEITNGLLWDLGGPYRSGGSWRNLTTFVNAGIAAVKQVSSSTRVLLHLDSGGSWSTTSYWISSFISNGGAWGSVDAVGFSFYPMWQGSFGDLRSVLSGMSASHPSKEVWIVETAWYWTRSAASYTGPYAQTPDGQYQFLRDLVGVVDDYSNVKGVFYWGAGWAVTSRWLRAPGWSNDDAATRSLFDGNGRATKGIDGLTGGTGPTQPTTYALTISVTGSGSVSPAPGVYTFPAGAVVTLTAVPASGATFTGWSGAVTGATNPVTVTMTGDRAVTAGFSAASGGGNAPCANPVTMSGGQSGNFNTTGPVCLRTAATVLGWGCSNFAGRTVSVNGGAASSACGGGPLPLAKLADGYTYFVISGGTYPWASLYFW
jgi:arabinogalactan endo-1,4-beta-galactosidase